MADTIFALATPAGRSGVAVVRVSGPDAVSISDKICRIPDAGSFRLSKLRDQSGAVVDQALVLRFAKGRSFTGEDVVEFQCHGSLAVISKLTALLRELGCRDADPGEFTRRALENSALSLVEVEALADLIDAETEQQHAQAIRAFSGSLRSEIDDLAQSLRHAIALLEATIDFADEDVPVDVKPEVRERLNTVKTRLSVLDKSAASAHRVREGFKVAILGAPNVGKSTLINFIAGEDIAITSDIAGTTRDVVKVRVDLDGFLVEFADTAGLRETTDVVESIGIERAQSYARSADLRVFLQDGSGDAVPEIIGASDVVLSAKRDDGSDGGISGKTGAGVESLLALVKDRLATDQVGDTALIRERQAEGVRSALRSVDSAIDGIARDALEELIVADLYAARQSLDFVLGRLGVEDVLDDIFSSFCIGK